MAVLINVLLLRNTKSQKLEATRTTTKEKESNYFYYNLLHTNIHSSLKTFDDLALFSMLVILCTLVVLISKIINGIP